MLTLLRIRAARRIKCHHCPLVREETTTPPAPRVTQYNKWEITPTTPAERKDLWNEAKRVLDEKRASNIISHDLLQEEIAPSPENRTIQEIEQDWHRARQQPVTLAQVNKKLKSGKTTREERLELYEVQKRLQEDTEAGVKPKRNRRNTPRPPVVF